MDPNQKFQLAFKLDDIELAKSPSDYSISISKYILYDCLTLYGSDNNVYNYVWNHRLKQYDPTDLLTELTREYRDSIDGKLLEKLFGKLLDALKGDIRLNYTEVYDSCEVCKCGRKLLKKFIRQQYGGDAYEELRLEYINN